MFFDRLNQNKKRPLKAVFPKFLNANYFANFTTSFSEPFVIFTTYRPFFTMFKSMALPSAFVFSVFIYFPLISYSEREMFPFVEV